MILQPVRALFCLIFALGLILVHFCVRLTDGLGERMYTAHTANTGRKLQLRVAFHSGTGRSLPHALYHMFPGPDVRHQQQEFIAALAHQHIGLA